MTGGRGEQTVTDTATFAGLLRRARRHAGLTQQQLADFATVSVRAVRDLETGRSLAPRRETVLLLAAQLGLSRPALARFEELAASGRSGPGRTGRGLAAEIAGIWHRCGDPVVWLTPADLADRAPAVPDAERALLVLEGADTLADRAEDVVRLLRDRPGLRVVTTGRSA